MTSRFSRLLVILIAVACLGSFIALAVAVRSDGDMVRFDHALATSLHERAAPGLITVMRVLTWLGLQGLWVLLVLTGLALVMRRRWLLLTFLVTSWTGGVLINTVTKAIFVRPRPNFDAPLATAMFYSFPSGHAMFSAIVYGMLAFLLARQTKNVWLRVLIVAAAAALVALVGFSRLYLGVHYFSDVAAGVLLGLAWLALCILGMEIASERAAAYHKLGGQGL